MCFASSVSRGAQNRCAIGARGDATIGAAGRPVEGDMNWVDLLIVAIVAWTTFRAFSNGLVREVVTLLAVVLGLVLAGTLYDNLAANLEFIVDDPTTRRLIAFAAIFAGVAVAGKIL